MLNELGWQVAEHENLDSFCRETPSHGALMVRQRSMLLPLKHLMTLFGEAGLWLPVIVYSREPRVEQIIEALKNGALDYLCLPISRDRLSDALARVETEGVVRSEGLRKKNEARRRIRQLSAREREVLEWLAEGCSNKAIARHLGISPRTVEIHRATMKEKLGADHPSRLVRLLLDSGLDPTVVKPNGTGKPSDGDAHRRTVNLLPSLREQISTLKRATNARIAGRRGRRAKS